MLYAIVQLSPFRVIDYLRVFPDPIRWPDGSATHGASVGTERDGMTVVAIRYINQSPPNEFYSLGGENLSLNGTILTITRSWVADPLRKVQDTLITRLGYAGKEAVRATVAVDEVVEIRLERVREAKAALGTTTWPLGTYPLLEAIGSTPVVASSVLSTWGELIQRAAAVDRTVHMGALAIAQSTTVDGAVAVYDAVSLGAS